MFYIILLYDYYGAEILYYYMFNLFIYLAHNNIQYLYIELLSIHNVFVEIKKNTDRMTV